MPVKIIDRTYTHLGRPGDTNINWLLGNVGVWQKLTLTCEFEVAINFTTTNVLFMEEPNTFTLGDGSEWREQGFEVGDNFEVKWALTDSSNVTQVYTVTGTIQSINGSIMTSNNTTLGGGAQASNIYPYQGADVKAHSVFIRADKRPQGIRFQYGHLKNSEVDGINLNSFIDGTATEFEIEDTDIMTPGQIKDFDFIGLQSGMSVASCKLAYIAQAGTKYFYGIEIIFMISSFFDDVNNLINGVSPSVTYGKECLTDNFLITGFPVYNNPNITIQNDPSQTKRLGQTGWFNENFNGLPNPFTVSSVTYSNSSSTIVPQLDYANPILVTAVIDGVQNLSSATRCMYGFGLVPIVEEDYKSQPQGNQYTTGYHQNTLINTGGTASSFADVFNVSNTIDPTLRQGYSNQAARMDVQNVRFQQTGANQITFQAEFVPNAEFVSLMESRDISERNYILWVSVADQNEITNDADRVSLLLDFKQLDTFIEPIGAFPGMEITFFDHTQDETSEVCPCGQDWRIEDEILSMIDFRIDTAQANDIPVPTAITYGVVIKRNSDDFSYLLDRYKIDLTQYPNPTQYNFDASKGFKLPVGNNKNFIKVDYYPPLDTGTEKGIRGFYAFKIRWEDWLPRLGVPQEVINDFYDNTKKADGLNNDWYNYLTNAGWTMSFVVYIDAQLNGQRVVYENLKELNFVDYDANDNVTTELRYYRQSDNTQLIGGTDPETGKPLGVILKNELVRLEIDYVLTVGTWGSLSDIYGINAIEVFEGAGQLEYRQLSTEYAPELGNPLLPLPGDTVLDLQIINPSTLRCSCLIDYNKLIPATKYKVTGREGCKNVDCDANVPEILLSSIRNTTTNNSSPTEALIAAPNPFANPDNFTFVIDAKNGNGTAYTGDYEIAATAIRQNGTTFSLGKALYNTGQAANSAPVSSDATWNSWGGGTGFNSYLTGTWSDGGTVGFRKITFAKNNNDPSLSALGLLQNENSVEVLFEITIKESCNPSEGLGGTSIFVQTKGNSENNPNAELIGYTNGDWQTQREADLILAGRGVGFVRDFYIDLHPEADYYFTGQGVNETNSGGGDKSVKLSEALKDRSGQNWRNIWTYSDDSFRFAAIRGGFGTNTQTRVVYGCQLDYQDPLNIHNGTQYPVLFTTGSGTSDGSSGRFGFVQPITGYTDGEDSNYNNTKGMPIFGPSQTVIGTASVAPSQFQIHCIIDDWRHNDRPIALFYLLSSGGISIQCNSGTYASTSYSTVINAAGLGILGVANSVHYSKADGSIYAYTRQSSSGTTTQRLYKIDHNGGAYDDPLNYSAALLMQFNFATGTELTRTLASTTGTFDLYPYGLANIVPSDNLVVNGYAVLYLQDIWGNCLVELKHNGGVASSPADWDYEVVAGVFGHGNPTPSRASGIGAAAEFDFVGDLNSTPIAITGSPYFRMFAREVYIAIRNQGQFIKYDPLTKEVLYLSGEYGDSFNGSLTIT